jgi:hypothetical protein
VHPRRAARREQETIPSIIEDQFGKTYDHIDNGIYYLQVYFYSPPPLSTLWLWSARCA